MSISKEINEAIELARAKGKKEVHLKKYGVTILTRLLTIDDFITKEEQKTPKNPFCAHEPLRKYKHLLKNCVHCCKNNNCFHKDACLAKFKKGEVVIEGDVS